MDFPTSAILEARLAEAVLRDLFPCDLGDTIEVVHDVEVLEIELECEVEPSEAYDKLELDPPQVSEDLATARFARVLEPALVRETLAETVPYPRIRFAGDSA